MLRLFRFAASAVLFAGFALVGPALAADRSHGGPPHSGGFTHTQSFHGTMPHHDFRGSPPNFHGVMPRGGPSPSLGGMHHEFGRPGHDLSMFRSHDFSHFTLQERNSWQRGSWRHAWHNGHYGWWWFVDDFWFFYPQPIYPYPAYIGADSYYDYYDRYGAPSYYWYYCEDPRGYYPYIQRCNVPWQPVPPTVDGP